MSGKTRFHFTGICGTAMGAVAAAMQDRGFTVTGSDANVYPPMSDFLRSRGIHITEGFHEDNIPADTDVIVIGNAISRGNPEAEAALDRKLLYQSLPEVMKEHFLRGKRNFVVSGTHGKTTTSSMLAWIFRHAGKNPGYMIGGLPKNLGCGAHFTDSDINVLEGDEYDTAFFDKRSKFVHYLPECVIVNNIEFDHADIYNSIDEIKLSFRRLINIVPRGGCAFINGDEQHCIDVATPAPCPVVSIGFSPTCGMPITGMIYAPEHSTFTLAGETYTLPMTGEFNVRNAAMATAIRLAVQSLRQRHPGSRLWVIFEPRSNTTRRAVFQTELAEALAAADFAVVAAIPDLHKIPENDRLDPAKLSADIHRLGGQAHYLPDLETIITHVAANALPGDVIAVLSNGGFGGIHQKLLDALTTPTPA